ncbi:hypothetical protein [Sulfuriroseicoccus oceanibius]|uniref:Uncharacterized protein n=1 Tax=Sulfuriroseicoccus oceanibius TaxID=2707525 RepID=A0A6B3L5P3_9BACT|nr:hypothetical protein [Sulfuriroseicoccus oceanibius]QQL45274.1 hypothetical protein G3M56_001420 [Sulfuriroseicoccus oceanibius]
MANFRAISPPIPYIHGLIRNGKPRPRHHKKIPARRLVELPAFTIPLTNRAIARQLQASPRRRRSI